MYGFERNSFEAEDVLETVRELSEKVTDDCTWSGAVLFACSLLGCSEERLAERAGITI